jgi:hypothetical protein
VELVFTMSMLWLGYQELPAPKPFGRGTWYDRLHRASDKMTKERFQAESERVLAEYQDLIPERVAQIRRFIAGDRSVEEDGIFVSCHITDEQLEAVQDKLRKISPESWTENRTN